MDFKFIYSAFIFFTFAVVAHAQVTVDTISNKYKLVYEKGQAQYQYTDKNNAKKILAIPSEYQQQLLLNDPAVRTSEKIKPGREKLVYQGKIFSIENFKPLCPLSFDKVYGEVENAFIVSRNDSCFLLHIENCALHFIHELVAEDLVLAYNYQTIQVYNPYQQTLTLYNVQGELISTINLEGYFFSPLDNGYHIRLGLDQNSLQQWNFQNRIVNNKGELVTTGKIISQGKDVLAIAQEAGGIHYYFKDQKIELPKGAKSFSYNRGDRFCTIKMDNDLNGIYSLDFANEILPPKYKSINYLSLDDIPNEDYQTRYFHYENGEFYFYAVDELGQMHIFDYEGNEVKLNRQYKNVTITHVRMDELDFFTLTDKELNTHIYDRNWTFIATESDKTIDKNKADGITNYYYLNKRKSINPKTFTHFADSFSKDFYFILNNKKGGQNIFDRNFKPLLSKDYRGIIKISPTHFILSDKAVQISESKGTSTIIELR